MRSLALAALVTLAASSIASSIARAQPAPSCAPDDHGAAARAERAYRAALKAKHLTPLTTPLGPIVTWAVAPAGRPGQIVEVEHQQVLVIGDAAEGVAPPVDLVLDRKQRVHLVQRALDATRTITVQGCTCSHGGAMRRSMRYGLAVPEHAKLGDPITIRYRGPAIITQEPAMCASLP